MSPDPGSGHQSMMASGDGGVVRCSAVGVEVRDCDLEILGTNFSFDWRGCRVARAFENWGTGQAPAAPLNFPSALWPPFPSLTPTVPALLLPKHSRASAL